jgi:hypothetical protein
VRGILELLRALSGIAVFAAIAAAGAGETDAGGPDRSPLARLSTLDTPLAPAAASTAYPSPPAFEVVYVVKTQAQASLADLGETDRSPPRPYRVLFAPDGDESVSLADLLLDAAQRDLADGLVQVVDLRGVDAGHLCRATCD